MRSLWFGRRKTAQSRRVGVESFQHDSVFLARRRRVRRGFPVIHFAAFIYLASVLRVFAIAEVGPGSYAGRMETMQNGNFVERAAAFVMAPDDVSRRLARNLQKGFALIGGQTL